MTRGKSRLTVVVSESVQCSTLFKIASHVIKVYYATLSYELRNSLKKEEK